MFLVVVVIVIVPAPLLRHFIEYGADDVRVGLLEKALGGLGILRADVAAADDEHGAVGLAADDGSIGNDEYGRCVDENVVIRRLHAREQFFHLRGAQKLGWIRRHGAARDEVEIRIDFVLDNVGKREVVGKAVAEAAIRDAEAAVHDRAAQIAVDEQHAFLILSEGDSEVGDRRRFAFAWQCRSERDDFDGLVRTRELQIRADGAVCLRDGRQAVVMGDEIDVCH